MADVETSGPGAPGVGPDPSWVWPWWLTRQLDPSSPAHVAGAGAARNTTGRNWTLAGDLDGRPVARVDPRGYVVPHGGWPAGGRWGLDWWIGAEDRWHLPAREAGTAVEQSLVEGAPVVETRVRVPGGHAVQRVWCVRAPVQRGEPGPLLAVVEVENRSRVPFALALAVRPADLDGVGSLGELGVAADHLTVDGRAAVLLPTRPSRTVGGTAATGDSAAVVLGGEAGSGLAGELRCDRGLAQAAVVFPLAHTASLRAAVVLAPMPPGARPAVDLAALPPWEAVVRGWGTHLDRGLRVRVPDRRLQDATRAAQGALLVARVGLLDTAVAVGDVVAAAGALDRWGFHDEAGELLAGALERQRLDGGFGERGAPPVEADVLDAAGRHAAVTADPTFAAAALEQVALAARRLGRRRRRTPEGERLAAARGLRGAAAVFALADEPRAAAGAGADTARLGDATAWPDDGLAAVDASLSSATTTWSRPTEADAGGAGTAGDGADVGHAAALLSTARDLLVREVDDPDGRPALALLAAVPDDWLGGDVEVHGAPTAHGTLSYAVRWHGPRPALLWELTRPEAAAGPVALTVPGLDPTWRTTEPRGEALLGEVLPPGGLPGVVGEVAATTPAADAPREPDSFT